MTKLQRDFETWKEQFREVCKEFNGVPNDRDEWNIRFAIPTDLGALNASIHESDYDEQKKHGFVSIYLRFLKYSTGKVYDTLHAMEFNGYSGKWNISTSTCGANPDLAGVRRAALSELRTRLEHVTVNLRAVTV